MEFGCQISEGEYVRANKLFTRSSRKHLVAYAVIITVLILTAALTESESLRYYAIFGLIGGIVGYVVVRHILAPWLTRRQYSEYNAIHEPFNITLEDNGIRFIAADSNTLVKWSHLMKWRENNEFILI